MLKATRVDDIDFEWSGGRTVAHKDLPNGAFELYTSMKNEGFVGMIFVCPCGCRRATSLSFESPGQKGWSWNGDEHEPTISPSVWSHRTCGYHGHLTNGIWQSC